MFPTTTKNIRAFTKKNVLLKLQPICLNLKRNLSLVDSNEESLDLIKLISVFVPEERNLY